MANWIGTGGSDPGDVATNGKLGIGTSAPASKLHVQNAISSKDFSDPINSNLVLQDITSMKEGVGGAIIFQGYKTGTTLVGNFTAIDSYKENATSGNESGALRLHTSNSSGTLSEVMRLTSGGNVGVGTTSPAAKLEVAGDVRITDGAGNGSLVIVPPPDTAANNKQHIQDAIDLVAANGGGTVMLQNGTYEMDKTEVGSGQDTYSYGILLKRGVRLVGCSMTGTVLKAIASGVSTTDRFSVIRVERYSDSAHIPVFIENLMVDGNSNSNITGIFIGNGEFVSAGNTDVQHVHVQNVWVQNCSGSDGWGIHVNSWFTELEACRISSCIIGINLDYLYTNLNGSASIGEDHTNATGIYHSQVWACSQYGIHIKGINNQVIGCNIGGIPDGAYGIYIRDYGNRANYLTGNYIETDFDHTNAVGIYIESKGNSVIGQYFDFPSGREVLFSSSDIHAGNVIMGNYNGHPGIDGPLNNQIFGSVGIGETSPSAKLDIVHSGSGSRGIEVNSGSNATDGVVINADGISASAWALLIYNSVNKKGVDYNGNGYFGGNVGVGTDSPGAALEVNGFTKLGSDAPKIKFMKFSGTVPASGNLEVNLPVGLDRSKIISSTIQLQSSVPDWQYPGNSYSNKGYNWYITNTQMVATTIGSDLRSHPYIITLVYEE